MDKEPKLTVKRAKFVKAIVEGKPKYKAAMEAFGIEHQPTASVRASAELKNVNVQMALQEAMARQGITIDKIVKPIADGLDAIKIVTSPTEPDKEIPDHAIRLKASGMAQTLLGVKQDGGSSNTVFIQVVQDERTNYDI